MAAGKQKLKKLEEDTQAQWDIINEAEKAQNQTAEEIASLKEELSEAKQACAAAEKERDNAEAAASRKISKRADELESHWKIYFSSGKRDISVRRDFSQQMAKFETRLELDAERKMKEIFDAKDPTSVADRGKMRTKEATWHCKVHDGYRLHYLWHGDTNTVEFVSCISHAKQDKMR